MERVHKNEYIELKDKYYFKIKDFFEYINGEHDGTSESPYGDLPSILSNFANEWIELKIRNGELVEASKVRSDMVAMFDEIERNSDVIGSPYTEKQYCLQESRFLELKKTYKGELKYEENF